MTEHGSSQSARDCGADVSAYALGALEPAEADALARHLETCAICRDELISFQQVVDVLPMSAPYHRAPKALRRRVLAEVAADRASQRAAARRSSRPRWPSFVSRRSAFSLATGLAIAVIAVGASQLGGSSSNRARIFPAQVIGVGSAQIRVSDGHAELVLHHFAPPPAGEIYEVWLLRRNHPPQATRALFSVTDGDVDVPGSVRGVYQVMVTPEPAGGSPAPTHPAVITAALV